MNELAQLNINKGVAYRDYKSFERSSNLSGNILYTANQPEEVVLVLCGSIELDLFGEVGIIH